MASSSSQLKSSSLKPSSSASASHRKSRWESSSSAANANNQPSGSKSNHTKPTKPHPNSKPSPKLNKGPSPKPAAAPDALAPPSGAAFPFPDFGPPPAPTYGFHMLERRSIVLADGSVRSYFALPPDYQNLPPPRFIPPGPVPSGGGMRFPPMSPEGLGFRDGNQIRDQNHGAAMKRKHPGGVEEEFKYGNSNPNGFHSAGAGRSSPFRRIDDLRPGKYMRIGGDSAGVIHKHLQVDPSKLKKAFLHFAKLINETEAERRRYLENGKHARLPCVACNRSKDFPDVHALIMHTYNAENAEFHVDHLGLHKALCVLLGWNFTKIPDSSRGYQFLPADEAASNQDDLMIWPPVVIIHNTATGKSKEGRIEGLGNKAMDSKIRALGFPGGKSKSLYGREGHQGTTHVKFAGDTPGLREAVGLSDHFAKQNRGRNAWERVQAATGGKSDDRNPDLVKLDRSGDKTKVLYGYLATAADLPRFDFDTKKKLTLESVREYEGFQVGRPPR